MQDCSFCERFVKLSSSFASDMVKISFDSSNKVRPVSPGAKDMSNSRTALEMTTRSSFRAKFLPMPMVHC